MIASCVTFTIEHNSVPPVYVHTLVPCERWGIPNSFNVWLCCIRFMRSTHEQTVRYQNKCSRSGCVSWDVCTEISLMVISLGKHVDILKALFSSVSVLELFLLKFQHLVNSFNLLCLLLLLYAVHCAWRLARVLSAPRDRRCYIRALLSFWIVLFWLLGLRGAFPTVCSWR